MRQSLQASLNRDDSTALKGIAILLMIMHHVLIKDYYIDPDVSLFSNIVISRLMVLGKVCVGLFMFVTAYGYALKKKRDWLYSFSHIKRLLVRYWALLLVFIALGILAGNHPDSITVLLNIFGLSSAYSCANWYVYFYIYAMLVLPLLSWLVDRYGVWTVLLSVVVCGVASFLLKSDDLWLKVVRECLFYTPVLVVGCYLAQSGVSFIKHRFSTIELVLVLVLVLAAGCMSRDIYGFCTFTVIIPVMAWMMVALLRHQSLQSLRAVLIKLGQLSLYMWFVHSVFFSSMTRSLFQQSNLWPKNLILVYLVVFGISLLVSVLLARVDKAMTRK